MDTEPTTESDDNNMPVQDRDIDQRAKGPMSPKQDTDDEGGRAKGPMSPSE